MSALTDRIAAEHRIYQTGGGTLRCRARGCRWEGAPTDTACATHIADVTGLREPHHNCLDYVHDPHWTPRRTR